MSDRKALSSDMRTGQFSLPPELWSIIGEKVQQVSAVVLVIVLRNFDNIFQAQGRKALLALVKTCRNFRSIFGPFLYSQRTIRLNQFRYSRLDQERLPPGLVHTKHLEISLHEFRRLDGVYSTEKNPAYASLLVKMLREIPNLQSFQFVSDPASPTLLPH